MLDPSDGENESWDPRGTKFVLGFSLQRGIEFGIEFGEFLLDETKLDRV